MRLVCTEIADWGVCHYNQADLLGCTPFRGLCSSRAPDQQRSAALRKADVAELTLKLDISERCLAVSSAEAH